MRTLRLIAGVVCTTTMAFGGISELPNDAQTLIAA